jgi:NIPSNAP
MIVEERCYTVRPGTVALYYKDYDPRGLGIQTRILGNLIGYFHTDVRCLLPTANGRSTSSSPPTSS